MDNLTQGHSMNADKQPGPSPALKKPDGKWTFYVYPEGKEAGQCEAKATATEARFKAVIRWGANGQKYGPMGVITRQSLFAK